MIKHRHLRKDRSGAAAAENALVLATVGETLAEMILHLRPAGLGLLLGQKAVAIGIEFSEMLTHLGDHLVASIDALGHRRHRRGLRYGLHGWSLGNGSACKDDACRADQKFFHQYLPLKFPEGDSPPILYRA